MFAQMILLNGKKKLKLVYKMEKPIKILVAGVGGQGVVFLTDLIVEAAMFSDIPVSTSEIHGLAQRGGTVTAGITIGENAFGFIEKASVDILIGLEPLEAQRCASFLYEESISVIDNNQILPFSVSSGNSNYPETKKFIEYLKSNIKDVIYVTEKSGGTKAVHRNLFVLGKLCASGHFPIDVSYIEKAIKKTVHSGFEEVGLEIFRKGCLKNKIIIE